MNNIEKVLDANQSILDFVNGYELMPENNYNYNIQKEFYGAKGIKETNYEEKYPYKDDLSLIAPVKTEVAPVKTVAERLKDERAKRMAAEKQVRFLNDALQDAMLLADNYRDDRMKVDLELAKARHLILEQKTAREKLRMDAMGLQEEVDRRKAEDAERIRRNRVGPKTFRGRIEQQRDVDLGDDDE